MLMINSHKCSPPHEQVKLIRLKQTIYKKFVQLREFVESDLNTKTSQKKVRKIKEKNTKPFLHE